MASLLRADLRRIVRPHGSFLLYLVIFLAFVLVTLIAAPIVTNMLANASQSAETKVEPFTGFASSLNLFTGLISFGWGSLMTSWCALSICWADMRGGFDRTIASSCGKKTYFAEKLLLALVLSCAFIVIGMVVSLVAGLIIGLQSMSSPLSVLLWFVFTVLECWGCAALTLAVLWVSKNNSVASGVGLTLAMGIISSIVGMAVASIPALAELWSNITPWLPVSAFGHLQTVVDGGFAPELIDVAHILVPAAVCVGVSYVVAQVVLPKRDM